MIIVQLEVERISDGAMRGFHRRQPYNAYFVGDQKASDSEKNCAFVFAVAENQGETCNATHLKKPVLEEKILMALQQELSLIWGQ